MGSSTGLWRALVSAFADTFYEMNGRLLTVTTAAYASPAGTLAVDGTHRWPTSGKFVTGGMVGEYTGKTASSLTGVTGLHTDVGEGAVVMDWSASSTQLDDLRGSFLTGLAEGDQLDTLARNFGVYRPRGVDDSTFRAVVRAMLYLDATTIYACEKVLEGLLGAGNFTVYEDLISDLHTVYVVLNAAPASQYQGKSYLVGAEAQPRDSATQVTADDDPVEVYGIWDSADPDRVGTNYALGSFACFTDAAQPRRLQSLAPIFTPQMVGNPVFLPGDYGHWRILAYLDAHTVQLGWPTRSDASLRSWEPTKLTTADGWFPEWAGPTTASVVISASLAPNNGAYAISARDSKNKLTLTGAAFVTESDATWTLVPQFPTTAMTAEMPAWSVAGPVITVPGPLPANVRLDYVTVPSAQVQARPSVDGSGAYPLYLWDQGAVAALLLDLITAAGVRVIVETV